MQETSSQEITSKILRDYGPKLTEKSTFYQDSGPICDEEYIRTQSQVDLTLDDLFMVAGETQKPVGIYVKGSINKLQQKNESFSRKTNTGGDSWYIPVDVGFFMILNPINLSVVILFIDAFRMFEDDSSVFPFPFYKNMIYSSIEEAYNYMKHQLYYLDTEDNYGYKNNKEDPYSNRKQKQYLVDPMSRLYVASQRFSGCKNYRPYFSSYVESPRTYIDNLYYSMILILLGKKGLKRFKIKKIYGIEASDLDVFREHLEEDRKDVLDMIRVEKATVASLTLSRYLEERELAKRIGEMTMNL